MSDLNSSASSRQEPAAVRVVWTHAGGFASFCGSLGLDWEEIIPNAPKLVQRPVEWRERVLPSQHF